MAKSSSADDDETDKKTLLKNHQRVWVFCTHNHLNLLAAHDYLYLVTWRPLSSNTHMCRRLSRRHALFSFISFFCFALFLCVEYFPCFMMRTWYSTYIFHRIEKSEVAEQTLFTEGLHTRTTRPWPKSSK